MLILKMSKRLLIAMLVSLLAFSFPSISTVAVEPGDGFDAIVPTFSSVEPIFYGEPSIETELNPRDEHEGAIDPAAPEGTALGSPAPANPSAVTIEDTETPLAMPNMLDIGQHWSVASLLFVVFGALVEIVFVTTYFVGRKRYDEYDRVDADEYEDRRPPISFKPASLLSPALAVTGLLLFVFTQDIAQPIVFVDGWTSIQAVIFLLQPTIIFLSIRKRSFEEDLDVADL